MTASARPPLGSPLALAVDGGPLDRPPTSRDDRAPVPAAGTARTLLLGAKGAGLVDMVELGLAVPHGFTITTDGCRRFLDRGWDDALEDVLLAGLAGLEARTGCRLGDPDRPLLVSVRSGAARSMPGMLDTVLDVGATADVLAGLAADDGDFARDTGLRALLSHAAVVAQAPAPVLDRARDLADPDAVRALLVDHGVVVPADPVDELRLAVRAVFASWRASRARRFRAVTGIPEDLGTAVTIQAMVFGNRGGRSGTGVALTRDPATGEPGLVGDFLPHAQGQDVVDGTHAPRPLTDLATTWPDVWADLTEGAARLERHLVDVVDIEFTVEDGTLWMLQARPGATGALATVRAAVDMALADDFPLDRAGAVQRCRHLLADPPTTPGAASGVADGHVVASGIAASPGRGVGVLCTDLDEAVALAADGVAVVLARRDTSPADVHGMAAAVGLVTATGGLVSHAAVVARSWDLPAVVGTGVVVDADGVTGPGGHVRVGEVVTVDGDGGHLLRGAHHDGGHLADVVATVRAWADELGVPLDRVTPAPGSD